MKKILITMAVDDSFRERMLKVTDPKEYELVFKGNAAKGEAEIDADDIIGVSAVLGHLPMRLMPYADKLEWLQTQSAGVDRYATILPEQVILTNAVGRYGVAVSEHMTALTLAVMKNLPVYSASQFKNTWMRGSRQAKQGEGTTVLVGVRRDTSKPMPEFFDEQYGQEDLEKILPLADVVAMVIPGGHQTAKYMDAHRLSLMKEGAVIVNAGRGVSIDTEALIEALRSGHLSGAGLDVTDPEPLNEDNELWSMENVLITPHIAGMLEGNRDRVSAILLENLRRFCNGEPLLNVVDKQLGY